MTSSFATPEPAPPLTGGAGSFVVRGGDDAVPAADGPVGDGPTAATVDRGSTPTATSGRLAPVDVADGLVRVRLEVSYDGTDFAGWAVQPAQRTVAGTLTEALERILQVPVRLEVAGRTDAGVHASAQVAHVDLPVEAWHSTSQTLVRRLGGVLPDDVRVRAAVPAPPHFHARFSALARTYSYRIADAQWGVEPLRRTQIVHWPRPLQLEPMRQASATVLGLHDFAAFCRRREGATTIRTLQEFDWARTEDGALEATVRADAFCHSMVRSLVGAMIAVGDGRRAPDWPGTLISRHQRANDVQVAPARGLTLVRVDYPDAESLDQRNAETRQTRVR